MTWEFLADGTKSAAEFGLTWLCQSSALLALGLVAGRLLGGSGPAVQSAAGRTTLIAVLACPVASALLARAGLDGITLRLPVAASATAEVRRAPGFDPALIEIIRQGPLAGATGRPTSSTPPAVDPRGVIGASRISTPTGRPSLITAS